MQLFSSFVTFIKGLVNADVQISFTLETGNSLSFSAEMDMGLLVKTITENEAEYVWSDFWGYAIPIRDLIFSHYDSDGVAGYRVAGTNTLVWRDQLHSVALAA